MRDQVVRQLRRQTGAAGRRVPVNWPGQLRFLRTRCACVVVDLSSAGASVLASGVPESVDELKLVLEIGPPIAAAIVWRSHDRLGLCFHGEQDWIGEIGRRRFDPAAWLHQP